MIAPPPPPPDSITPPPPPDDQPPPPPPSSNRPPSPPPPPPGAPGKKKAGWGGQRDRGPLSIEEIIKKKREADEAAKKPKFLSKAEREKLALEKRTKEVEEQKRRLATDAAAAVPSKLGDDRNGTRDGPPHHSLRNGSNGSGPGPIPTGPRAQRSTGDVPRGPAAMRAPNNRPPSNVGSTGGKGAGEKRAPAEVEAALVRHRYMGAEQNQSTFSAKKKRRRTTEKKFNFEWNAEEDTSPDYNPLYAQRAEANFYGRGRLGGFAEDATAGGAQKYAQALEQQDTEAGRARAREMMEMERRRKEDFGRGALDMHWSEKRLADMRERDWRIFKEDFNISTKGGAIPNPMRSWAESGLPKALMDVVALVGYTEPSPVQRAAIPIALQSRDLIAVAVTGSGKTAAFLLPLLVYISDLPPLGDLTKNDGPYAIILAPTRELAQQIEIEAKKFATPLGFTCVSIVGGHSLEEQAYALRNGAEIVIATPGRLVDCIERRVLVLGQCCYVIMDEADRMIDLGFEEPVNKILDALPVSNEKPDTEEAEDATLMRKSLGGKDRYRQTMMYTATMAPAIERIARKYLRRPATVTIGNIGEAVETVEQRVEFIAGEDKRKKRLADILTSREFPPPIIVFVNIKRNCDAVARDIKHLGLSAVTLHGSKTQEQREAALASVRNGNTDVLVATDLAGRGIDVQDVSLVVNFNMANSIESYTHRIGRTGRAGKSGVAITFLGNEDTDVMYDIKQMLMKSSLSRVPEELRKHEAAQQKSQRGGSQKKIEESSGFAAYDTLVGTSFNHHSLSLVSGPSPQRVRADSMADLSFGGSDEENAELKKLNADVAEDPDNFENWEKVVRAAEALEGGLNRNSSPQSIAATRDVYDRFLAKFPLLFGYWKKYADLEFSIAGTEAAEMVYERGVASVTNSVDLWTNYCGFKVETSHDADVIRELFERGATCVGLDFLAHPFWDKYLEFEERLESVDKIFAILDRVVHIPMHQYARYFERFRQLAQSRPLTELLPPDLLQQFRREIEAEGATVVQAGAQQLKAEKGELEMEREMRRRIDNFHLEIFARTQTETTKRWTYEAEIKRPYFHVTELDEAQLVNWRKYLDFEEVEGDYVRAQFLYERCLVTCAFYDEFWFRYARWMLAQKDREEEVRHIFQRACQCYVPTSRPAIRLQYAYFEETAQRVDLAQDIHRAVLMALPGHVETIVSWANLQRRQHGLPAAIEIYESQINAQECDLYAKAALCAEWARLLWKIRGSAEEARQVFQKNQHWYLDSRAFWINYLQFELDQPTSAETETTQYLRIKQVHDDIRRKSHLPPLTIKDLTHYYMVYLLERGTKEAAKEYLTLDREVNGQVSPPFSVQSVNKSKLAEDGQESTTNRRMLMENGHPGVEVDEAAIRRGQDPYTKYYQQQGDHPTPVNGQAAAPTPAYGL
ncbi:MAG: mRNA splicing protein prp28 [Thelocarpon superellum]|nr:MAG: mRNA splicing protein prp28 [Thelocarpon superellum]